MNKREREKLGRAALKKLNTKKRWSQAKRMIFLTFRALMISKS